MSSSPKRVLSRVAPHEFVGRSDELAQIVTHGTSARDGRGMLLLLEPAAGVSELLRQAYDQVFNEHSEVVPIYFGFSRNYRTAVSGAIEFLNAFLQQYIAFRRDEPELCNSPMTLQDLVSIAPGPDLEWVVQLVETYNLLRFSKDDLGLVRFCLAAPQRVPARLARPFVILDGAELADKLNGSLRLGTEVLRVFDRASFSFVLAGLRRQVLKAAHDARSDFDRLDLLHVQRLEAEQAGLLVERIAQRQLVVISDETRDLIVQQFSGSPLFITRFFQAAREKGLSLHSYLDVERLYTDEVMGGHIHRHFDNLLEQISPTVEARQALIRLLWEAYASESQGGSFEAWRKRLQLSPEELENVLHGLHVQEFLNWDGSTIEPVGAPQAWRDYLKVRYRLEVHNEPRALVVAETLTDALKRAPNTMAHHYRRLTRFDLRHLVSQFDCQRVPAMLFDHADFRQKYVGAIDDETIDGIEKEPGSIRLPQVVHVASCTSFNADMRQVCDEARCVLAHAFEDGGYIDAQEVVWLAAEIESKLGVEAEIAELWFDRLQLLAIGLGLRRYRVWLISNEGFSDEACKVLKRHGCLTSNRQQVELLASRLSNQHHKPIVHTPDADEFLVVVPMGEENELVAATTVEQIAKRLSFKPEAINQIKTAIVEACINASEHSFSPDKKIYQRFRVESDRLVITISSRGIVPVGISSGTGGTSTSGGEEDIQSEARRGWGLKLIRKLMDEVEFERVDEGTSLRMTKYFHSSSS